MRQLNRMLRPRYVAAFQVHLAPRVEADVAEFDRELASVVQGNGVSGCVAVSTWAPAVATHRIATIFPDDTGSFAERRGSIVDLLYLDKLAFPILRGSLSKLRDDVSDYRWDIEVHCAKSVESQERHESDLDYVKGTEPYLYAQLLPLGVESPEELIGRRYSFPQSPDDDPADWEPDQWPFFCLYRTRPADHVLDKEIIVEGIA